LTAYWVTWALTAASDGSSTVKFKQQTGEFCTYHDILDYIFFIIVGMFGGCMGALFNQIVEHLNHLRYVLNVFHLFFVIVSTSVPFVFVVLTTFCFVSFLFCWPFFFWQSPSHKQVRRQTCH
jgi:H+/Cl- antiporter ClcA